jgi:hypothetical protein
MPLKHNKKKAKEWAGHIQPFTQWHNAGEFFHMPEA